MSYEARVAVIGAGVVGLAVAAEISQHTCGVFVLEKNHGFGLETSSRNSEVIHAGIYYPEDSLKTRLCIEGKNLLYELCGNGSIRCRKAGKIIVAVEEDEIPQLENLCEQGKRNGVEDLVLLSQEEVRRLEPNVSCRAGLLSPSSGIVDSYSLLKYLYVRARGNGAQLVFNTEVVGIERRGTKYQIQIKDREGISSFESHAVVNAAGLNSDKLAQLAGIDISEAGYRLHYCKGEYFGLSAKYSKLVTRLIYPLPGEASLGIHVTLTLDGRVRLGPNARYTDSIDYGVDEAQKQLFYDSVKRFFPAVRQEDMEPEFAGIRPKLQGSGEAFRDFVIADESTRGFPGLINLIGIESPGLTASLAIGRYVWQMIREILA